MLAIMGPSGAGKTTLLSFLASKVAPEYKTSGIVKANGATFGASQFYSFGSFVYQNDILFEALTVRCNY
jgi:ABC-type multidrug transport system ATPase subunit